MGWPGLWPMLYASSPASRAVVRGHPLSCLYSVFTVPIKSYFHQNINNKKDGAPFAHPVSCLF